MKLSSERIVKKLAHRAFMKRDRREMVKKAVIAPYLKEQKRRRLAHRRTNWKGLD